MLAAGQTLTLPKKGGSDQKQLISIGVFDPTLLLLLVLMFVWRDGCEYIIQESVYWSDPDKKMSTKIQYHQYQFLARSI